MFSLNTSDLNDLRSAGRISSARSDPFFKETTMYKMTLPALLCVATLLTMTPATGWAEETTSAKNATASTTAESDSQDDLSKEEDEKAAAAMDEAQKAYAKGNYEETFIIVEPLAALEHPAAEYLLGKMYEFGHGVNKDMQKALDLFTSAASKGYAAAQAKLGQWNLEAGKDYDLALNWFNRAAEQGYALAYSSLGDMYAKGYGVDQDYAKAIDCYQKAAQNGDPQACLKLGIMYEKGEGVPADLKQAVFWYQKGADLGDAESAASLKRIKS